MIKVSFMYPNSEDATFDMKYYCDVHIPLVLGKLGSAVKGVAVERGMHGGQPGSRPPYLACGHLLFDTVDDYVNSFGRHAQVITDDIKNYTNTTPTALIAEVEELGVRS